MSAGTVLVGAAGYAFVALGGHTLPTADAAALSSFYLLVNIIGPGLFVALEQETNRATSSALATRSNPRPVIRRAATHGAVLLGVVFLVLGAMSPFLVDRSLLGHWELFWAIVLSTVTAAAVYLVRGVLGGMQQFDGYAATLAGEGLMRLLPALLLAAAGLATAGLYGFVFALGSGIGAIAALGWLRRGVGVQSSQTAAVPADLVAADPGLDLARSPRSDAGRVRGLAPLVSATLLAQIVANLAPIIVTARLTVDAATAAAFASGFILARVPLFVFSPLQAVVLPAVAEAAAHGDTARVHRIVRPVLLAATGVSVVGTALLITAGPWAVRTLFGAEAPLSGTVLGLLGVGTLLLIAAQILQAALVALRAHLAVTASWQLSIVTLIALLMLPINPVHAAVVGQLTSSAVVVVAMSATLVVRLRGATAAVSTVPATSS
jgi:O-antigen/teichoic acid export membrane protein